MNTNKFIYKPFELGQQDMVYELVWEVFSEFEAPEYSKEGAAVFREFIKPERLAEEVMKNDFRIYCCFDKEELIGVIAVRNTTHISLLFVKKIYHRNGIAKSLLEIAIAAARKSKADLTELTVNSSPYAVEVYKRLGFTATNTMQVKDGIIYMPMKKIIDTD